METNFEWGRGFDGGVSYQGIFDEVTGKIGLRLDSIFSNAVWEWRRGIGFPGDCVEFFEDYLIAETLFTVEHEIVHKLLFNDGGLAVSIAFDNVSGFDLRNFFDVDEVI